MRKEILDTGISVVYEPPGRVPIVDVVIVHGLHGHPYKSWLKKPSSTTKSLQTSPEVQGDGRQSGLRKLSWKSAKSTPVDDNEKPVLKDTLGGVDSESEPIFWPQDLLPSECPDARILVFGYDSKITKYLSGPANKGSLLAHGKDLLFSLIRERLVGRPLVFVAHSLGGIVVKEALARSSISSDLALKDVVKSTAAVMFLGTPHRGSPDLAALGEYVRSIASTLGIDTSPALLDTLGLKTTDLERAQESFSAIWQEYDFQVKTFQEGLPVVKLGLGALTTKIVPDYSSTLGDHRERAETLQANHNELCRFSGDKDPNYRKVAGEFRSIYISIQKLREKTAHEENHKQLVQPQFQDLPSIQRMQLPGDDHLSDEETRALQWLWSPGLHARYHGIGRPAARDQEGLTYTTVWDEEDFQSFFYLAFTQPGSKSLFIFIDALDECHADSVRQQAYFWRDATMTARENGVSLNVCISSRHFPSITLSNCPEIVIEDHNQDDITIFVEQKFQLGIAADADQWATLRDRILEKSAGIFLWAVLVVEEVLRKWDEGQGFNVLDHRLDLNLIGDGHLSIMHSCLDYLNIMELDALIQARARAKEGRVEATKRTQATHQSRPANPAPKISYPGAEYSAQGDLDNEASNGKPVLEALVASSEPDGEPDITRWLEVSQAAIEDASPSASVADSYDSRVEKPGLDPAFVITPEAGLEGDFRVDNNPFAFSPGQLNMLMYPKSLNVFSTLGGLDGIVCGLQSDTTAGLSVDETTVLGTVSFDEATTPKAEQRSSASRAYISSAQPFEDRIRVFKSNVLPRNKTPPWWYFTHTKNRRSWAMLSVPAIIALVLGVYQTVIDDDISRRGFSTSHEATVVGGRFSSTELYKINSSAGRSLWKPEINPALRQALIEAISVTSSAYQSDAHMGNTFVGSKIEVALLRFADAHLGLQNLEEVRSNVETVHRMAFSPSRQYAGAVVKRNNGYRLYIIGAADTVLGWCETEINEEFEQTPLQQGRREAHIEAISQYSTQSSTTISIAYKDFTHWPISGLETIHGISSDKDSSLHGPTLIGIISVSNSLRDGITDAVMDAQKAGISVRLVTGESLATARAIASESGILTDGLTLEGPIFRRLSKEEMGVILPRIQILARASPEDKRAMVGRLKDLGETVALCDDNAEADVALKSANVSFSKGISGTEMAKTTSSIILMYDSFDIIVKAIRWSRSLTAAVRRCIQFQLPGIIAVVLTVVITAVADKDMKPTIGASQLLWICLILNPVAALALATNTSTIRALDSKPEFKPSLITSNMWKMIVGQSVYQLTVTLVLYFNGPLILGFDTSDLALKTKLNTIIFNTFFWMQIFNAFNSRRLDNKLNIFEDAHRDISFIGIICLAAGIQVVIILFGSAAFQTRPGGLDNIDWAICVVTASVSLVWGGLLRLVPDPWIFSIIKPFDKLVQKLRGLVCSSRSPEGEDEYNGY
ncbi:unnamed protein product [Clonostachys rhizophaga]|uniref:Cation-transporting P-type ATPase C-terminal domain-containing protein n=1 Tax=Clonostachys rhizophaga TaxID=160324 RepID=A0A9N9YWU2_9HYPO|nr:unnamed protein product [Clonostachys rhizophaga]